MPTIPWTAGPATDPHGDVIVMASQFRLRSLRHVPGFLRAALAIRRQTRRAPGAVGVSLRAAPLRRTFWTLSAWESREAIDALVAAEPHRTVMRTMRPAMASAVFTFWETPADRLPGWPEADRRLAEQQRVTP
ncbi:hypothetical protein GCM10010441_08570 [Kitasatospora paracochleata]|uniref:Heme-degrading monooxygenase HmoA n=1 Tax=Kitasatospora paracochleata TaxID=58354 RepID=A0ABT1IX84_9ACTN|nr:DUF3291 domain-containing protein [Kitasatospora paracochleata]MCP2309757.1 heme-degrading monooxygenase HmoA [Kitasatospora paracochleata]